MFDNFENYLIVIGIRSLEYNYSDEILFGNKEYFKTCYESRLSPYKALLFLYDYENDIDKFKNNEDDNS